MKRALVRILILTNALFFEKSISQNFVPNPSFEIVDTCPDNLGQIYYAKPWFQTREYYKNHRTPSSSDYFNSCAGSTSILSTPTNVMGFQYPIGGDGYSGIIFLSKNVLFPNLREYIEVPLNKKLVRGKLYCVEMYVNLAESSMFSISRFGFSFTNDTVSTSQLSLNFEYPLSYFGYYPQVENDSNLIINDTLNWVLISGSFIASGGERFLTIGNFYDDNRTPFQITGFGTQPYAYYYIDDVSVTCCDNSGTCEEAIIENLFIPNAFSPNGDGVNDRLRVLGNASKIEFKVFDRWGEMVYSYTGGEMPLGTGWDGTYKGKALDNAVFVYFANVVLPDGKEVQLKGNVSLIK